MVKELSSKANIPVFILAGGLGTRIAEETTIRPKPMVEVGSIPILLHIMRFYYSYGFNDFVICTGYRSWDIKEYFINYQFRLNDLRIDHRISANSPPVAYGYNAEQERWRVSVFDTGLDSMTGARLAQAIDRLSQNTSFTNFAVTYGDGLCDADLDLELAFHLEHGKMGTVLGVPPPARFGELDVTNGHKVAGFLEKPESRTGQINGGYFFFRREFRDYLGDSNDCILERSPLMELAADGGLMVFQHAGFWQPMDTLRDKTFLQSLWDRGSAPWLRVRTGEYGLDDVMASGNAHTGGYSPEKVIQEVTR